MEKEVELDAKLKTLNFRISKTDEILNKNDRLSAERQKNSLENIAETVNALKEILEEQKFGKGETEETIKEWAKEIEAVLSQADKCAKELSNQIMQIDRDLKQANAFQEHKQAIELEEEKIKLQQVAAERAHAEQLEFERKRLELQQQHAQTKSVNQDGAHSSAVKMPKLIITKFNGTPQDWLRFWGQFDTQIDKSTASALTKFSYLKELVELKVRNLIDGLPFTDEGYVKAKELLLKRYGNTSEVVGAYVRNILELPTVKERDVTKIHAFYETLLFNVESLQTLPNLNKLDAAVRFTFDKLEVIKNELTMVNENWTEWTFVQFLEALEKWTINNPIRDIQNPKTTNSRREKSTLFFSKRNESGSQPTRGCLYCSSGDHKAISCDKVVKPEERKKILAEKRLCFNCTGARHRAVECKSKNTCQVCQGKHHTSICDQTRTPLEPGMTANHVGDSTVIHPVVVVKINGYKFRALLDSGASHSYASSTVINLIKAKPKSTGVRQIAMLTGITTRTMQVYEVVMCALTGDFNLDVNVTKIETRELLTLDNPRYKIILDGDAHLRGVHMDDDDEKDQLPVHLILGANDFAKIRTGERLRVGRRGDPVAEFTRFGWTIMSPGADQDVSQGQLAVSSSTDYDNLSALDVLGLADTTGDQEDVFGEFKEQLTRSEEGWYETALPWKGNHPSLPTNHNGSLRRLNYLVRKLRRDDILAEYDAVIREQLIEGIVEKAPAEVTGKEFYLPHRAVVRENAESTKLRVVYDASAREHDNAPSLNDCLHTGPPLQNQLFSVITRNRFHAVAVVGDLQKAFLQVRVREAERDALRFHWLVDLQSSDIETLRFTRVVFGLAPSPFLLNGVIQQHLKSVESRYPESVMEVRKSLYVDDLISGGPTVGEAKQLKSEAVEIFDEAKFKLHKWHSNVPELETDRDIGEPSYAKQQLGELSTNGDCKLLGLKWDKVDDTLHVSFPIQPATLTKRGILANLAKVYDPLGLVSPEMLEGKLIYRETCEMKMSWDAPLPAAVAKKWVRWEQKLPETVPVPRSLTSHQEQIEEVKLHAFGDASGRGVSAAVYAVVTQQSGVKQGLVAAKSRLVKSGLTIPRLELVSGHMAVNLAVNVRKALEGFNLAENIQCWLDSTVALHWLNDQGEYRQFVANRVKKIQSHPNTLWRHVPTTDNPADLGSRGGRVTGEELWWNGPSWLADQTKWPVDIVTQPSEDSKAERKVQQELVAVGVEGSDDLDTVLDKFGLRKALRVFAWVSRFIHNSRHASEKINGFLTTSEIEAQELFWIKRTQRQGMNATTFAEDKEQLNLQLNSEGVWECRGRIQGEYPIYLPDSGLFTRKLVQREHVTTLHGGIGLTMAKVRERYWVPRLRQLARGLRKKCWGCKRFQVAAVKCPPPGLLPKARTEGTTPFKVIGVDFAGPLKYRSKGNGEKKAYVVLYSCSLIRGVFLELLPSLETKEFIKSFKRLIARRGRPSKVYSDNGSTFIAAAKWLKKVRKDEKLNEFLCKQSITWQFNLSRAPWWGGQFERLIGLMKGAFYKTVGGGLLMWDELSEVLLDIEVTINNRPLSYLEEDIQLPTLTPNSLLFINANNMPELQPYHQEEKDLRKRAKFLKKTKDAMWRRWTTEYLRALRERHRLKHDGDGNHLAVGDVVIIKSTERNRNQWPLGIVKHLIVGRDGIVRGATLRAGMNHMERAVQHLYPLELSCDADVKAEDVQKEVPVSTTLDPDASVFRPRRDAAVAAEMRVQEVLNDEQQG